MPLFSFDVKWSVNRPIAETFSLAHQLIKSKQIKKLKIKKSMPYTFVLAKYSDREIQIGFEDRAGYTLVFAKVFYKKPKERSKIEYALNELKYRMGGSDVTTIPVSKEVVIKEKEIVKKYCPYCGTLNPIGTDRCSHCGGKLH